jgi:hypothetical protein
MKNNLLKWPPKVRSLVVLGFIAGVISVYGFNCAQKGEFETLILQPITAFNHPIDDPIEKLSTSDEQILNYEGVVQSMLRVTNQSDMGDVYGSSLRNDFDSYKSLLPEGGDILRTTGPTLVAMTNVASRVCANLINKERALGKDSRDFFGRVDFAASSFPGMDQQTVRNMAESFWGHEVSADEWSAITSAATEFNNADGSTGMTKTYNFYLSMCTGLLSSFDSLTY